MCLGVPGKIISRNDNSAVADINGNQVKVSVALTPEAEVGKYVLIHAGFAMQIIDEHIARETMNYVLELQRLGEAYEN
jgi:hydrogenase expression/formation protein HypC